MQSPLPNSAIGEATLVFRGGADHIRFSVDPSLPEICEATFEGPQPAVRQSVNRVEIEKPKMLGWRRQTGTIKLSPSVAWRIEIRGGVSNLRADLLGLRLTALEIHGGASDVDVRVDWPTGQVPLLITGGASKVTVVRRAGSAASVKVGGGASQLTLDSQTFGAIGGPTRLETPSYQETEDRFDLTVESGANQASVVTA